MSYFHQVTDTKSIWMLLKVHDSNFNEVIYKFLNWPTELFNFALQIVFQSSIGYIWGTLEVIVIGYKLFLMILFHGEETFKCLWFEIVCICTG